jgi:hypothetical protein
VIRNCRNHGPQPLENFRYYLAYLYKGKEIYCYRCRLCEHERSAAKYAADPDKSKAAVKKWRKENPERSKQLQRDYLARNPEKRNEFRKQARIRRQETRLTVLKHYGGDPPECACCKEKHLEFLCVDHVNGGGNKHRRQLKRATERFFAWLIEQDFPTGYRVLCHNCNQSFSAYGFCPHQS